MTTAYTLPDLSNIGNSLAYYIDTSGLTKLEYFCTPAQPEALLTDKSRRIMRLEKDKVTDEFVQGKCIKFAGGTPSFEFTAINLADVQSFTYL